MWWHILVIPALRRLGQEACEFEGNLDYIVEPCLKKPKKRKKITVKQYAVLGQQQPHPLCVYHIYF
jgi:hypothetical protein